jgi:hypothetical protein
MSGAATDEGERMATGPLFDFYEKVVVQGVRPSFIQGVKPSFKLLAAPSTSRAIGRTHSVRPKRIETRADHLDSVRPKRIETRSDHLDVGHADPRTTRLYDRRQKKVM